MEKKKPRKGILSVLWILWLALLWSAGTARADEIIYFDNDPMGNPIAATDEWGQVIWKESYRPYGERLDRSPAGLGNRQWYAGKQEERETGLLYLGARYYHPALGRFMSPDPKGVNPEDPHSFNRYAYGNNNPYRYYDPDGRNPLDVGFLIYDLGNLGYALYKGEGVGEAATGLGLSVVGIISPLPGVGQALKAARAAEHAVDAGRVIEHGAAAAKSGEQVAKEIGILRDAAKGKGNFGLGQATASEAEALGQAWVGPNYRVASDGKTLVSSDGLRTYRPPSPKNSPYATTGTQANFEQLEIVKGRPAVISNGHLNVTP